MNKEIIGGATGTGLSALGTIIQTNDVLQTISLVITIIGALISFIIVPIITWYNKSKEDGKFTKDEIKEGIDIIKDGSNKINELTNKEVNKDEK